MADEPISALTLFTSYSTADEVEILDVSDTTFASTGTNKRIQFSTLLTMAGVGTTATGDVTLAPGASTRNVIQPTGDYIALALEASASQTHHLQEWQNSSGTALAYVDSSGNINTPTVTATTGNFSEINFGTQGGTVSSPTPTTLMTFQPTDTTKGPWQIVSHCTLFGTFQDSILSIGYNTSPSGSYTLGTPVLATEPMWHMQFEQDYWNSGTSSYCCEWYIEYVPVSPIGSMNDYRPYMVSLNRATAAADVLIEIGPSGDPNYGLFAVTSSGANLFTITPSNVTVLSTNLNCNYFWATQTLEVSLPSIANGSHGYAITGTIGSTSQSGGLLVSLGGIPSATTSSRYGFVYCADSGAVRPILIGSNNGTTFAPTSWTGTFSNHSGTYSAAATDRNLMVTNSSSTAWVLTLPASSSGIAGLEYCIKKTDANTNGITITPSGSDKIDGASTYTLNAQYQYVRIVNDGSANWFILGSGTA